MHLADPKLFGSVGIKGNVFELGQIMVACQQRFGMVHPFLDDLTFMLQTLQMVGNGAEFGNTP